MKRPKLSSDQIDLLFEIVRRRAPRLRGIAETLAHGELIKANDAEALEDVLADAMLSEGYDAQQEELTRHGMAVDDLIGLVWQLSEEFDQPAHQGNAS